MTVNRLFCNVEQAFNFQKDAQCLIGHLTKLKIGDVEYKADIKLTNPADGDKVSVVGVISTINWSVGQSDLCAFNSRVSETNKSFASVQVDTILSDTSVEVSFIIYDYDPIANKFYQKIDCDSATLNGLLSKSNGDLEIDIGSDQATDVVSPKNYNFYFSIIPIEVEQKINESSNASVTYVKSFGITVGS
jgi:hypothetical protein